MAANHHGRAKLARVTGYLAAALITVWSLVAIAAYAAIGTVASWMAAYTAPESWIARSAELAGQAGGTVVAILWLAGTLIVLSARSVIRWLIT
jgi:hypothetical protein